MVGMRRTLVSLALLSCLPPSLCCMRGSAEAAAAQEHQLARGAGRYLCTLAKKRGRRVVAVFGFTNERNEETPETRRTTTRFLSEVSECGLKVIDRSHLEQVLAQQALSRSGLVDSETGPATGKLLGADSLVFGAIDSVSIQIRVVDAQTGEILGVTVAEASVVQKEDKSGFAPKRFPPERTGAVEPSGVPGIAVRRLSVVSARRSFDEQQLKRWLVRLRRDRPRIFLHVAASERESSQLSASPRAARLLAEVQGEVAGLGAEERNQLGTFRVRVQALRSRLAASERALHAAVETETRRLLERPQK